MPTLNWIGKDKVVNHHLDVPYRVIEHRHAFGEPDSGNMIIHGDNLDALKSLMPRYEGRVKCIYIDPPYNTGNEGWVYNDNVNDPKIKKWLGKVVGSEVVKITGMGIQGYAIAIMSESVSINFNKSNTQRESSKWSGCLDDLVRKGLMETGGKRERYTLTGKGYAEADRVDRKLLDDFLEKEKTEEIE